MSKGSNGAGPPTKRPPSAAPPSYVSVLYEEPPSSVDSPGSDVFHDLHLDDIIAAVVKGREGYDLAAIFEAPLGDVASVEFRHAVFADFEEVATAEAVAAFCDRLRDVRESLATAKEVYYRQQKLWWFLHGVVQYGEAVTDLATVLQARPIGSRGLRGVRDFLASYVASPPFRELTSDATELTSALESLTYTLQLRGNQIRVFHYDSEADYSASVAATFAKFRHDSFDQATREHPVGNSMNHIEAQVLDGVASLHPEVFEPLARFATLHGQFLDETVARFDREAQFYLAYLDYARIFRRVGLPLCYPETSGEDQRVLGKQVFDLALAKSLVDRGEVVVCNDFELREGERIFVVSGPNQGGKTTFARTIGQMHYLASLGCPVPGRQARLFLFDRILTHFEREEHIENLRGKLEDDLERVAAVLERATARSILIMNEIFSSTTVSDAEYLGRKVLERVIDIGALAVYVTFVDELSTLSEATVSMVATVDPDNPVVRTFLVLRKPADGKSYALALARKYELTYEDVKGRVAG